MTSPKPAQCPGPRRLALSCRLTEQTVARVTPSVPDWFDDDRTRFMQAGVSISLGARNAALRPSVTRGLGCRVLPGGEVRIYVDATLSADLLRDVESTARVAVVFSDIVRHRTLQVKATDARVHELDEDDQQAVEAYVDRFAEVVVSLGYPASVPRSLLASARTARAAIVCHPHEGFEQTPGPQAGQRLEAAR